MWMPSLFQWDFLPVLPHVILTVPFVVRVMLPAMRSVEPQWQEQAQVLNLSSFQSWYHGYFSFVRGPAVVASSLTVAFSLGEFGASWLLVRAGSWDTLSVVVDQLMSRPKFDPLIQPAAMAAASVLMGPALIALILIPLEPKSLAKYFTLASRADLHTPITL